MHSFKEDYEVSNRAKTIKHLAWAADVLMTDGVTDKGADSDLTECLWSMMTIIHRQAREIEVIIDDKSKEPSCL